MSINIIAPYSRIIITEFVLNNLIPKLKLKAYANRKIMGDISMGWD